MTKNQLQQSFHPRNRRAKSLSEPQNWNVFGNRKFSQNIHIWLGENI